MKTLCGLNLLKTSVCSVIGLLFAIFCLYTRAQSLLFCQIKKFENLNDISNVYCIEKEKEISILPIRLADRKMDKHVNLLYVQNDNDVGYFAWIKNLSRVVSSQLSKHKNKKYFCDRYVYIK